MTTTKGTTRRAPWAVFLTALLATLAMVLGSLVIAAPANAKNDPDKTPPGQSEQGPPGHQDDGTVPPGHDDVLPPGQQDRPNTEKKIWICHADTNKGQGNTNLGVENDAGFGTGGEYGIGFNLIYISVSAWENAHDKLHPNDVPALSNGSSFYCPGASKIVPAEVCVAPVGTTTYTKVTFYGREGTSMDTWTTQADGKGTLYTAYTKAASDSLCTPITNPKTLTAEYCAALTGTMQYGLVTFTGTEGTDESTWLNGTTPKSAYTIDATKVMCLTPEAATALDAAVAAAVPQPATIGGAPATIKVPAKGPTLPAAVPAGDGSTAPTVPLAALAAMVLGATALAISTMRLVGTKR